MSTINVPHWLSKPEADIIEVILRCAAERGYLVAVHDGEEMATDFVEPAAAALYIGLTEHTKLAFKDADCEGREKFALKGTVLLAHGNDADVIADCTDNPFIDDLLAEASELAELLSEAGF